MNVAYKGPLPEVSEADALLMDVPRSIVLAPGMKLGAASPVQEGFRQ
jgi:hypothetical protein